MLRPVTLILRTKQTIKKILFTRNSINIKETLMFLVNFLWYGYEWVVHALL